MNIASLDGLEVVVSNDDEIGRIHQEGQLFDVSITHDNSTVSENFRPIVLNEIDSTVGVGAKFDGVLRIVQSVNLTENFQSSNKEV